MAPNPKHCPECDLIDVAGLMLQCGSPDHDRQYSLLWHCFCDGYPEPPDGLWLCPPCRSRYDGVLTGYSTPLQVNLPGSTGDSPITSTLRILCALRAFNDFPPGLYHSQLPHNPPQNSGRKLEMPRHYVQQVPQMHRVVGEEMEAINAEQMRHTKELVEALMDIKTNCQLARVETAVSKDMLLRFKRVLDEYTNHYEWSWREPASFLHECLRALVMASDKSTASERGAYQSQEHQENLRLQRGTPLPPISQDARQFWKAYRAEGRQTPLFDSFAVQVATERICPLYGREARTFQHFEVLHLSSMPNTTMSDCVMLTDLLEHWLSEQISPLGRCACGQEHEESGFGSRKITRCPFTLSIALERSIEQRMQSRVSVPQYLDLIPMVDQPSTASTTLYELKAICVRVDEAARCWSFIRVQDKWTIFKDEDYPLQGQCSHPQTFLNAGAHVSYAIYEQVPKAQLASKIRDERFCGGEILRTPRIPAQDETWPCPGMTQLHCHWRFSSARSAVVHFQTIHVDVVLMTGPLAPSLRSARPAQPDVRLQERIRQFEDKGCIVNPCQVFQAPGKYDWNENKDRHLAKERGFRSAKDVIHQRQVQMAVVGKHERPIVVFTPTDNKDFNLISNGFMPGWTINLDGTRPGQYLFVTALDEELAGGRSAREVIRSRQLLGGGRGNLERPLVKFRTWLGFAEAGSPAAEDDVSQALARGDTINPTNLLCEPGEYIFLDNKQAQIGHQHGFASAKEVVSSRQTSAVTCDEDSEPIVIFRPAFGHSTGLQRQTSSLVFTPAQASALSSAPKRNLGGAKYFGQLDHPIDLYPVAWTIKNWFSISPYFDSTAYSQNRKLAILPLHALLCQAFNDYAVNEGTIGVMKYFNTSTSFNLPGIEPTLLLYGYIQAGEKQKRLHRKRDPFSRAVEANAALPWQRPESLIMPVICSVPRFGHDKSSRKARKLHFELFITKERAMGMLKGKRAQRGPLLWLCSSTWSVFTDFRRLQERELEIELAVHHTPAGFIARFALDASSPCERWEGWVLYQLDYALDENVSKFLATCYRRARGAQTTKPEMPADPVEISESTQIFDMLFPEDSGAGMPPDHSSDIGDRPAMAFRSKSTPHENKTDTSFSQEQDVQAESSQTELYYPSLSDWSTESEDE